MFKHATVYNIPIRDQLPSSSDLEDALSKHRFIECGAIQQQSSGWVPPRAEHGRYVEIINGHWIIKLCTESKVLPGAVVQEALQERLKAIKDETGRQPGKKQIKEIKEEVVVDLLSKAFTKKAFLTAWIDPQQGFLMVDSSSVAKADALASLLVKSTDSHSFPISMVHTETSPATAMADWLCIQDAPSPLTIDRECELKGLDSATDKAKVKYSAHNIQIDEVVSHIKMGKRPTLLALTWNSRVSFQLRDTLQLSKLTFLDVVFESRSPRSKNADEAFDADVSILTGELAPLLRDVINALGGIASADASPGNDEEASSDGESSDQFAVESAND